MGSEGPWARFERGDLVEPNLGHWEFLGVRADGGVRVEKVSCGRERR